MHRSFFFRTFAVDLSMKKSIKMVLFLLLVLFGVSLAMLFHPAFGLWRHRSTERILASPNYRDGMFQNQEPKEILRFLFSPRLTSQARPGLKTP